MSRSKQFPVYVSLEEAAHIMSLSTRTLRRRISDGTIPAYQCGKRAIRIRLDELEAAYAASPPTDGGPPAPAALWPPQGPPPSPEEPRL